MSGKVLKKFREKYYLSQYQAARICRVNKRCWWRMEREIDIVPEQLLRLLPVVEAEIQRVMQYLKGYCQWCGKNVVKSKLSYRGLEMHHCCPYCGRFSTMARRPLVAMSLPYRPEVPHLEERYVKILQDLGYRRKNDKRRD